MLEAPVHSVVYNAYWQEHYTVLSHNDDGSVTVLWHGDARVSNPSPPRVTTHRTPLDKRDRIISTPDSRKPHVVIVDSGEDAGDITQYVVYGPISTEAEADQLMMRIHEAWALGTGAGSEEFAQVSKIIVAPLYDKSDAESHLTNEKEML